MRALIAVTHLLGAGHLTRAAALARALADAGHETVVVSGGMPSRIVHCGGARLVQLPPLRIAGTAFSRLLDGDGDPVDAGLLERRRVGLLAALDEFAPDVVVTELFPFGRRALAAEFLALVEAARARHPRPLVLASVRDILVAPEKPERIAQAHGRLADFYDAILVHGDPKLVPLDASWPLDARTARKIRYTGYVDEGAPAVGARPRAGVLVAAGSGPAGLGLFRAAAEAARNRPELGWRILVGHGVPDADFRTVGRGLAEGVVIRARSDYRTLLSGAALSVSQCGYNTAVDLLATGTPALLVPFEAGSETEQRLRAEVLAARGLGSVLPENDLSPHSLVEAITAAVTAPAPEPHGIDLDGAARSVAIIEGRVDRRARRRPPHLDGGGQDEGYDLSGQPTSLTPSLSRKGYRTHISRAAAVAPSLPPLRGRVAREAGRERGATRPDRALPSPDPRSRAGHPPPQRGEGDRASCDSDSSHPEVQERGGALQPAARSVAGFIEAAPAAPEDEVVSERSRRGRLEDLERTAPLDRLRATLDAAAAREISIGFWWRDDDAVAATPALDRLLALAAAHDAPLMLAAIPAEAEPSLGRRLARTTNVSLAVHGLAHDNHAPAGEKPAEFGAHRPLAALVGDAGRALACARRRFPADRLLPVFVPPWNRVAPALAAALPGLGYRGLSASVGSPVPGLARADATLDPIDWRGTRSLRTLDALVDGLIRDIADHPRRPIGLLTHHRVHDEAVWDFLEALLALLSGHPAIRVLDPRDLFGLAGRDRSDVDAGAAQPTFNTPARVRSR